MSELLPHIQLDPTGETTHTVIWLHGLGADGNDFAPIVPQLDFPQKTSTRFIFPHAPSQPVTINGGYVMPAWYDILEMKIDREVDVAQLRISVERIREFVQREQDQGIASEKILLAGFSQGAAVAYEVALSHPQPLAGLMVLSGYLAAGDTLARNPANRDLSVLIQHGTDDPIVPEILAQQALKQLQTWGYPTSYQSYPMQHSVCPPQIGDISRWLGERLAP